MYSDSCKANKLQFFCLSFCKSELIASTFFDKSVAKPERVRHMDTRLLWTHSLVKEKTVDVKPVSTLINTGDVDTKALTSNRMKCLLHILEM